MSQVESGLLNYNKKINKRFSEIDPTNSFVLDNKGNRVGKFIVRKYFGYSNNMLWAGWYTRLERLVILSEKLKKRHEDYWKNVFKPLIVKAWEKRPPGANCRVIPYHEKDNDYWIEISPYEDCFSYSTYNSNPHYKGDPLSPQNPNWENVYIGRNNPEEALEFLRVKFTCDHKHRMYDRVEGVILGIIYDKIEELSKEEYPPGSVLEFTIAGRRFLYHRETNGNGWCTWKALPAQTPKTCDVSKLITKNVR